MEHRDSETQRIIKGEEMAHLNQLSRDFIAAAIEVHRVLGPGLLESVYEVCLCEELLMRGIPFQTQVDLPLLYKGRDTGKTFKLDMLIDDTLIVELKAVEELKSVHEVQLLTYLKLTNKPIGLLVNFNVPYLRDGVKRKINGKIEYTGIKPVKE
jgi:GxxExxY protein